MVLHAGGFIDDDNLLATFGGHNGAAHARMTRAADDHVSVNRADDLIVDDLWLRAKPVEAIANITLRVTRGGASSGKIVVPGIAARGRGRASSCHGPASCQRAGRQGSLQEPAAIYRHLTHSLSFQSWPQLSRSHRYSTPCSLPSSDINVFEQTTATVAARISPLIGKAVPWKG